MFKHALKLGVVVVFCATAFSCGPDEETPGGGTGGVAGMLGGAGGMTGGVGGMGGAAGMTGGMGGMTGGVGGMGGMTGGVGGMAGGMGGMGGMPATGLPTWSAVYSEVIVAKGCTGGAQCHGGSAGMLSMADSDSAYTALFDVAAMAIFPGFPNCSESGLKRVAPSNPEQSVLYQKIAHMQTCGLEMPPGQPMLPMAQIEQVKMWIAGGALKN